MGMIAYISIGNSDDKLTQKEWSEYITAIIDKITPLAIRAHGVWYSSPQMPWQNACWCLEFWDDHIPALRETLAQIRTEHRQDSIALALVSETEFI